jgi:hypothetical protein
MYLVNSYFWFAVAGLMAVFIRIELAEPGRGDAGRGRPPQAAARRAGLEVGREESHKVRGLCRVKVPQAPLALLVLEPLPRSASDLS